MKYIEIGDIVISPDVVGVIDMYNDGEKITTNIYGKYNNLLAEMLEISTDFDKLNKSYGEQLLEDFKEYLNK